MYEPTAAYMNPLNSGTAPMRSTPSASYIHDPTSVLNSSMTVPVTWNSTITHSSRPDSSRVATITIWITTAAIVRKSLRASAASSGYQSRAATITTQQRRAEDARPRLLEDEHADLEQRPRALRLPAHRRAARCATPSIRRSSGVGWRIPRR